MKNALVRITRIVPFIALAAGPFAAVAACGGGAPPPAAEPTPPPLPPSMGQGTAAAPTPPPAAEAPEKGSAAVDRAVAAIQAGDFPKAKGALEQELRQNPKNGTASYYLGVALEGLGDKSEAEKRYKEALGNAPNLTEAAVNLGALYLDASRWDDAVAITQSGLARRADDPALHANLAVALKGKGDAQGAAQEYEKAVRGAGASADLHYAYGVLLLEMGNKPKAVSELKSALGSAGKNRPLLASVGRALGASGAFADCVAALDQALAAGDDAELRVRRGLCRHSLKDEAGAKADFEGALKINSKFAPAHYYLGESLLGAGQSAEAIKEFDLATRAAPDSELGKKAKLQADAARKGKRGK